MSDYKLPAISRDAVVFEGEHALRDVQAHANEYGTLVSFYNMEEANVSRDAYNDIVAHDTTPTFDVYALPVDYNPSKFTLEKIGLAEDTELVFFTPMLTWTQATLDIHDVDMIRWKVSVGGHEYMISEKREYGQHGDEFLYMVFGAKGL